MYKVCLDDGSRHEIVRQTRVSNIAARTRDRLEMIRLSGAGWSIPQIARHLQTHEQTVRHWIKAFLYDGFDALRDQPHIGQRSAITEAIVTAFKEQMTQTVRIWTAQQAANWASEKYGIVRSAKQWRKILKRNGLSYHRTGRGLRHKRKPEEVQAAKEEMADLEKKGAMNCSMSAISTKLVWR